MRARSDPEFRQQLLSRYLEQLLEELSVRRKERDSDSPEAARQIREGVALAVKLAERLQRSHFGPRAAQERLFCLARNLLRKPQCQL